MSFEWRSHRARLFNLHAEVDLCCKLDLRHVNSNCRNTEWNPRSKKVHDVLAFYNAHSYALAQAYNYIMVL